MRKRVWDAQSGISISNGIRLNKDGTLIYIRVKKVDDEEPNYYESELNKTHFDKFFGILAEAAAAIKNLTADIDEIDGGILLS